MLVWLLQCVVLGQGGMTSVASKLVASKLKSVKQTIGLGEIWGDHSGLHVLCKRGMDVTNMK